MSGPTVLFQTHNRRGLGHLMRGLNLAREMLELVPDARVVMQTRNAAAAAFCPPSVTCIVESGPGTSWREVLAASAPDLVVYDTLVPEHPDDEPLGAHTRVAMVLRKSRAEQHAEILASGFLERCDAIVVPHRPEEFGLPLPVEVARRTRFVGPVARRPDPRRQDALRRRYGLRPGEALLVSTAGGGGFAQSAGRFLQAVRAVQEALARVPIPVRHLVVLGPHHPGPPPVIPGAQVIPVEPALIDLFALADLVLSEGGYNSVSELRVVGTPAVFLPGDRRLDDQQERVGALAELGVARVVTLPAAADVVAGLLSRPGLLDAMRRRAMADPVPLGNRAAAEHLLGPMLSRTVV